MGKTEPGSVSGQKEGGRQVSEEQIIEFLQENIDYMVNNDLVLWMFRKIGWALAKLLSSLIDVGKTLYDFTFSLVDVTKWTGMEDWINEFRPLVQAILIISLAVLGMMYMFGKNKKHNVLTSVLIFAVVVTSSNYLFSQFSSWSVAFKDAVTGDGDLTSGAELIKNNLYDLRYIDDQIGLENMGEGNRPQYESLTDAEVKYIDITETLDWEDFDGDAADILQKELVYVNGNGSGGMLDDVYNGVLWTDMGNSMYFRYIFHWGTYYLEALAAFLIYFCLAYKNVRIIYELLVSRVLVTLQSANLSGKKKLVKILECIRDEYYALCFTAVTLRTFFIFTGFVGEMVDHAGAGGLTRGIVTLFVAFCVIDGSNVLQKITGVDAGLSSVTGKIAAGAHVAQGLQSARMQHQMSRYYRREEQDRKAADSQKRQNMAQGGNPASGTAGGMPPEDGKGKKDGTGAEKAAATGEVKDGKGMERQNMNGTPENADGMKNMDRMQEDMDGMKNMDGRGAAAAAEAGMEGAADPAGSEDGQGQGNLQEDSGQYAKAEADMKRMDQETGGDEAGQRKNPDQSDFGNADGNRKTAPDGNTVQESRTFQKWEEKAAKEKKQEQEKRDAFRETGMPAAKTDPARENTSAGTGRSRTVPDSGNRTSYRSNMPSAGTGNTETGGSSRTAGNSKTAGNGTDRHYRNISEGTVGRDRYVGGEAVPRRQNRKGDETK